MPEASPIPVLDGHNDTLTRIRHAPPEESRTFLERSEHGQLDLPRAREGGLAGGFFAIFTSSPTTGVSLRSSSATTGRSWPAAG